MTITKDLIKKCDALTQELIIEHKLNILYKIMEYLESNPSISNLQSYISAQCALLSYEKSTILKEATK